MYPSETCAFFNLMLAFWEVSVDMCRHSLFSLLYNILLYEFTTIFHSLLLNLWLLQTRYEWVYLRARHIYMARLIALFWCLFIHESIKQCFYLVGRTFKHFCLQFVLLIFWLFQPQVHKDILYFFQKVKICSSLIHLEKILMHNVTWNSLLFFSYH